MAAAATASALLVISGCEHRNIREEAAGQNETQKSRPQVKTRPGSHIRSTSPAFETSHTEAPSSLVLGKGEMEVANAARITIKNAIASAVLTSSTQVRDYPQANLTAALTSSTAALVVFPDHPESSAELRASLSKKFYFGNLPNPVQPPVQAVFSFYSGMQVISATTVTLASFVTDLPIEESHPERAKISELNAQLETKASEVADVAQNGDVPGTIEKAKQLQDAIKNYISSVSPEQNRTAGAALEMLREGAYEIQDRLNEKGHFEAGTSQALEMMTSGSLRLVTTIPE
jgi:hypothetical protein